VHGKSRGCPKTVHSNCRCTVRTTKKTSKLFYYNLLLIERLVFSSTTTIHRVSGAIAHTFGGSFTDNFLKSALDSSCKAVVYQKVPALVPILPRRIESIIPMILCQVWPDSFSA